MGGEFRNTKDEFRYRLLKQIEAQKRSKKLCFSITLVVVLLISVKLFSQSDGHGLIDRRRNLSSNEEETILPNLRNMIPSKRRKLSNEESSELRFVTFGTS